MRITGLDDRDHPIFNHTGPMPAGGQAEYVLTGATTYVFVVLAADRLLSGR